ncbi:hypothetical protein I4U23_026738 [Adineta vaga]|nr:hypothetical protein I4U23_026738 [Adineta vaga]
MNLFTREEYCSYNLWTNNIFRRLAIPGPLPIPFLGEIFNVIRKGIYQNDVDLIKKNMVKLLGFVKQSLDKFIDRLSDTTILDRFCLQILPSIQGKIECLSLESSSMRSVLQAASYPNLYALQLFNIDNKSARKLFKNKLLSASIFRTQIKILSLTYDRWYDNRVRLYFDDMLIVNFRSSTLLYLNIRVQSFHDCLYILDGRFNQLHTLIIDLVNPCDAGDVKKRDYLPNLKYFSFTCTYGVYFDNKTIRSLLRRMSNLERLSLFIAINNDTKFVDGNYLKKNILNFLSKLDQFQFSITSHIRSLMHINLPLTSDIQQTFLDFQTKNIISYVDYFPESDRGQCHIYSYPSQTTYLNSITNKFPGGLYQYVRKLSLFDEKPFEHEFFLRIGKSFPSMEILSVNNKKPQNCKDSNENLSLIQYSTLRELRICSAHDDYMEEFLLDTKTCLSKNVNLYIKYESLERVTQNFMRESTRINCTKVDKLYLSDRSKCSNSLEEYFPNTKIINVLRF